VRARVWAVVLAASALVPVAGCRQGPKSGSDSARPEGRQAGAGGAGARPGRPVAVSFVDVTAKAGIGFRHYNGAIGRKYYPESMGSGVAFLDYDNDGWVDLLFVNSQDWPDTPPGRRAAVQPTMHLYRNRGDGTFADVTGEAGLAVPVYGIGCAVGDYDNDGWEDLYVTAALGTSRLFHNHGDGRFEEVTERAGVSNQDQFATSATWFDYDRDGRLDLFVCNYIDWSPAKDLRCEILRGIKEYCTPQSYDGLPCRLYRNLGGGRFADVSSETGIRRAIGKSMSAAVCDFNDDGWPDLVVTNDTEPNFLFRNEAGRTFSEIGMEAGVALPESGKAKAGMGVDAADTANDGGLTILTSNFSGESLSFFAGQPGGMFLDMTAAAGFGITSQPYMGWGTFFFDYDLDGWKDAFVANGHLYPGVARYQAGPEYAERPLLYRNLGSGRFAEVGRQAGSGLAPLVGRGAAYGDFDNDGDLDIAVSANGGAARLIRNDGGNANHWLGVILEGVTSNRDGVGAVVRVVAGGMTQMQMARGGSSYASQSDRRLVFGLGTTPLVDRIEVRWPSGKTQVVREAAADQRLRIREPE
jgi:hypothetical protein